MDLKKKIYDKAWSADQGFGVPFEFSSQTKIFGMSKKNILVASTAHISKFNF